MENGFPTSPALLVVFDVFDVKHEFANVFSNENVDADDVVLLSESDDETAFNASPNKNVDPPPVTLFVAAAVVVVAAVFAAPNIGVKLKMELVSLFDANALFPNIFVVDAFALLFSLNDVCVKRFAPATLTLNSPKIFFVDSLVLFGLDDAEPTLIPPPNDKVFNEFWLLVEWIIFIGGITNGNGLSSVIFVFISLISINLKSSGLQPRHPSHFVCTIISSFIDAVLVVSLSVELLAESLKKKKNKHF